MAIWAIQSKEIREAHMNWHRATVLSSAFLLCAAGEIRGQVQSTTGQPLVTTASEIAGIQALADCPRVFLTTTWSSYDNNTSQTTLSYGLVECGSTTAVIGGGVIPNADFTVNRTGARLLTSTEHGLIDITWHLDGESRYSTDGTTLYTARKGDIVKTIHHSDSLSTIVSGSIGGRTFGVRPGYIATVKDTSSTHP
jgi:hypothetical protein